MGKAQKVALSHSILKANLWIYGADKNYGRQKSQENILGKRIWKIMSVKKKRNTTNNIMGKYSKFQVKMAVMLSVAMKILLAKRSTQNSKMDF